MATKKGKKPKGKKIKVTKPRKKPKASKKRKRGRGRGQYTNFFPTNRQVDSNQYWQLRAEIAGTEARVRTSLRDRQDEESKAEKKAEKKVEKLERDVAAVQAIRPQAAPNINFTPNIILGTPDGGGGGGGGGGRGGGEYNRGQEAVNARGVAKDRHHVDLSAETPARQPRARAATPVQHRRETTEEYAQREQEGLRGAIALRERGVQSLSRNVVSAWRTVAQTGLLKERLRKAGEPKTAHNLSETSSGAESPATAIERVTERIDAATERQAPPTTPPSAGRKAAAQRRRSVFHLGGDSPGGDHRVKRTTTAGGTEYEVSGGAAADAAAARDGLAAAGEAQLPPLGTPLGTLDL